MTWRSARRPPARADGFTPNGPQVMSPERQEAEQMADDAELPSRPSWELTIV